MMSGRLRFGLGLLLVLTTFPTQGIADQDIADAQPAAAHLNPQLSPGPAPGLTGKPWRLAELINEPLPEGENPPYLTFTNAGDLLGFGGCNYFVGKYRIGEDGKLIVSSLRASHKLCPEASKPETTLLTSLLLTNSWQLDAEKLTFFMNGTPLMKLTEAADLSIAELMQQGKLLKAKKARAHKKAPRKKKKIAGKARKPTKKAVPKVALKNQQASPKPTKLN